MAMRIYHKTFNGTLYYYAQRSFREKITPGAQGKTKGSGKSRVRTETIYLGTAEHIVEALTKTRQPLEVRIGKPVSREPGAAHFDAWLA